MKRKKILSISSTIDPETNKPQYTISVDLGPLSHCTTSVSGLNGERADASSLTEVATVDSVSLIQMPCILSVIPVMQAHALAINFVVEINLLTG